MFSMLINTSGQLPWAHNSWKAWVDHIVKQKEKYGFKKAALVTRQNGATASATTGFTVLPRDIKNIDLVMQGQKSTDRIMIKDKTYIIKAVSTNQLVAFNGNKYYIVCKSKRMFIVTVCESRSKLEDGTGWLSRLCNKLMERDY